jgi:hypothetical protein
LLNARDSVEQLAMMANQNCADSPDIETHKTANLKVIEHLDKRDDVVSPSLTQSHPSAQEFYDDVDFKRGSKP